MKSAAAGAGILLVLSGVLVASAEPLHDWLERRSIPYSDTPIYRAGTYESAARGYGGEVTVAMEFSEYGIESVSASGPDETPEIGGAALSVLQQQIRRQQTCYVEGVSGATATGDAVRAAAADCILMAADGENALAQQIKEEREAASGDSLPAIEELLLKVPDGFYTYLQEEGDENGYHDYVELTVEDHRLTSLVWDAVNVETQAGKRELSENGQYVMREDGPLWTEQADALAGYMLEHQSEEGLLNADGYATDAVASVSIYAGGYLNAVKECLLRAVPSAG